MLGLYPIVTQPVYLLGSPWFTEINVTVNGDKNLRIRSYGASDPAALGQAEYFVQSVKINGQAWTKNWFNHEDVMVDGGTIEFWVGEDITQVSYLFFGIQFVALDYLRVPLERCMVMRQCLETSHIALVLPTHLPEHPELHRISDTNRA